MSDSSYHHGDLKAALVAAAREQIHLEGADSLNLRALARNLGVTHPAVYRHFADKHALFVAVAEQGFTELAQALTASADQIEQRNSTDINGRLHAQASAYIDFAFRQPALMHVMFALISAQDRVQNPSLYAASKRCFELLTQYTTGETQENDEENSGENNNVVADAITIWAMVHGFAALVTEEQLPALADNAQREQILARAVNVLIKGLIQ